MTRVEVTFLGTVGSIPTKSRNHPAIYLKYQSENEYCCLFDCGEGTQKQIFTSGLNFMRINDIFITHWHADHFAGLLGLIQTMNMEQRTKPITIYAPEAEEFVPMLLNLGYSSKDFKVIIKNVEFEGTRRQKLMETKEFYIEAIPAKHGIPAVAYAFVEKDRINIDKDKAVKLGLPKKGMIYRKLKEKGKISFKGKSIKLEDISKVEKGKRIVYSGDTKPCKNILTLAKDADLLIHESTFFSEHLEGKHTTFEEAVEIAKKVKAKQTVLTHISRRYQDTRKLKEMIKDPSIKIAKDFMKVVVE